MNIDHLLEPLMASARAIIAAGYWTGPTGALRAADKETEHVAGLITSCVGPLMQAWSNILAGSGVSLAVQAVFLHQRPKVRFPSTTSALCGPGHCELADLLIVHEHDAIRRRAVLVQVKKLPGASVAGDQKDLYEKWEPFRFAAGAHGAKGRQYQIAPNDEGSRYGIVHVPAPLGVEPWWAEQPLGTRSAVDFGAMLAEMLVAGVAGEPTPAREALIGGSDDWSALIEDLLRVSLGVDYPLKGFWAKPQPRTARSVVSTTAQRPDGLTSWRAVSGVAAGLSDLFGGDGDRPDDAVDGPEGVSTLYFGTRSIG